MTVVYTSQLYKKSVLRYKLVTVSLHWNDQEETELRYGSGSSERVVPWRMVLRVHAFPDTGGLNFETKDGPIRFRAHLQADVDKWCACLPQVVRHSLSVRSALIGPAVLPVESTSRRGGELSTRFFSIARAVGGGKTGRRARPVETARGTPGHPAPRRHGHERGARWVIGMGQGDFASAIDTLGAKMTLVTPRAAAPAHGGRGSAEAGAQEQPAQAGGHAGAVRSGAAGTIVKDSTVGEALFYEETAP